MEYIAYLHKDKGSDYGVRFPDFPALSLPAPRWKRRVAWRAKYSRCTSPECGRRLARFFWSSKGAAVIPAHRRVGSGGRQLDDRTVKAAFAHHPFQLILRKGLLCCLFDQLSRSFKGCLFPVEAFNHRQLIPSCGVDTPHDPVALVSTVYLRSSARFSIPISSSQR
jgi:hypothetical protein